MKRIAVDSVVNLNLVQFHGKPIFDYFDDMAFVVIPIQNLNIDAQKDLDDSVVS